MIVRNPSQDGLVAIRRPTCRAPDGDEPVLAGVSHDHEDLQPRAPETAERGAPALVARLRPCDAASRGALLASDPAVRIRAHRPGVATVGPTCTRAVGCQ